VRGQIPVGHKPLLRVLEVPDPASFARAALIEALRKAGVSVEASPLAGEPLGSGASARGLFTTAPRRRVPLSAFPRRAKARFSKSAIICMRAPCHFCWRCATASARSAMDSNFERDFWPGLVVDVKTISFCGRGAEVLGLTTRHRERRCKLLRAMNQPFGLYDF